jgi:hypothetical protein
MNIFYSSAFGLRVWLSQGRRPAPFPSSSDIPPLSVFQAALAGKQFHPLSEHQAASIGTQFCVASAGTHFCV